MKLIQLIEELEGLQEELGNVPVYLSRDSEGNGFGTLETESSFHIADKKSIILFPHRENVEPEGWNS